MHCRIVLTRFTLRWLMLGVSLRKPTIYFNCTFYILLLSFGITYCIFLCVDFKATAYYFCLKFAVYLYSLDLINKIYCPINFLSVYWAIQNSTNRSLLRSWWKNMMMVWARLQIWLLVFCSLKSWRRRKIWKKGGGSLWKIGWGSLLSVRRGQLPPSLPVSTEFFKKKNLI